MVIAERRDAAQEGMRSRLDPQDRPRPHSQLRRTAFAQVQATTAKTARAKALSRILCEFLLGLGVDRSFLNTGTLRITELLASSRFSATGAL
jgi:hypothetical protein